MLEGITVTATISLDLRGGDVWAWQRPVTGTCPGCPPDATLALLVNGRSIPADRTGDAFSAVARLNPGKNEIVAVATLPDGSEVQSAPVISTMPLAARPTARLLARIDGTHVIFDATSSTPSEYDTAYISDWMLALSDSFPGLAEVSTADRGIWHWPAPAADGEYVASLTVSDTRGRRDTAKARVVVEGGLARVPDPIHERAGWIADAVIYGVVPRNVDPPTFFGVAARLDDLADLGITALWLAPITRTIPGDFGYGVTSYLDLRPEYGTKADFQALIAAAHARGLRVLMDFVPNHTSAEHPYFRNAESHGTSSPYWDFYDRHANGTPTHYFDWLHLPNLNFANPEVQRFMLEAFSHWMREFDVDGFRIDAVWGIKERNPAWLDCFLAEMKRIKPDSLLIAEASARDGFYAERGFDAAYDWTGELGHWAWSSVFDGSVCIGAAMVEALTNSGEGYHADALVMRFLNNNDTGPRFVTTHGVDCYRVALAMLLTLPGLPCLFTGDEVGAEFQPYDTTGPIDWSDHHGLRPDIKRLIELRRTTPTLHSRAWLPLTVNPATHVFAYLRTGETGRSVVVVLNFSATDLHATIELPDEVATTLAAGALVDLWSGETVAAPARGRISVSVPGWGFRLVTNDDA